MKMTGNIRLDAKRRMSRLLVSDEIQTRISSLQADCARFSADILEGISSTTENAHLNESEVFAIFELAEKMNIRMADEGGARLGNLNGHAAITMDFANLFALFQKIRANDRTA